MDTSAFRALPLVAAAAALILLAAFSPALWSSGPSAAGESLGPAPAFDGTARKLNATEQRWMRGETWHRGCPVPMRNLRMLTVSSYNFDEQIVKGRVVLHRKVAQDMLQVFEVLYDSEFPIEHLDTVELYPPAQRPDNLRNVTAAFNCRTIAGSSTWSQHAYGLAIDINPVQNPWVKDGKVVPNAGETYVDRSQRLEGMIKGGSDTVNAFDDIGWGWGGRWHALKDYMHFSLTGG